MADRTTRQRLHPFARVAATAALCAAGALAAGAVLAGCIGIISYQLEASLTQFTNEVVEVQGTNVRTIIGVKLSALHGASAFITAENISDEAALQDRFREIVESGAFARVGLVGADGTGFGFDRDLGELPRRSYADRPYFQAAMNGDDSVSDPLPDAWGSGLEGVVYAAPIYDIKHRGGAPIGVIVGTEPTAALASAIDTSLFEGNGYVRIIDAEGNLLFRPDHDVSAGYANVFDVPYEQPESLDGMRTDLAAGAGGTSQFTQMGDISRTAAYQPVGINDWFVQAVLPTAYLEQKNRTVLAASLAMAAFVVCVIAALTTAILRVRRRGKAQLAKAGLTDALTGLPNAVAFGHALGLHPDAFRGSRYLILLNFVGFSLFNTTFGYERGSRFLQDAATVLLQETNLGELAARLHGDRFLLLLEAPSPKAAGHRLRAIIRRIDAIALPDGTSYRLFSQCCLYRLRASDSQRDINLIVQDMAVPLRQAKRNLTQRIVYHDERSVASVARVRQIEGIMSSALVKQEFLAYFQPQYDITWPVPRLCGAEALVRWESPVLGMVRPDEFIPVFEENGFVDRIDGYMLERACIRLAQWSREGLRCVPVSVNLSRRNLARSDLAERIGRTVDSHGVPRNLIKLELTEGILAEDASRLADTLNHLRKSGFKVSMDDFGSGYSALPLLRDAPFDAVKLDRSFFAGSFRSARGRTMLVSVIDMLEKMGFETVAEGIEQECEVAQLRKWGCRTVQGYVFGRPLTAAAFVKEHLIPAQASAKASEERKALPSQSAGP